MENDIENKKEKALTAAEEWLQLVDSGNYTQSWEEASLLFQGSIEKVQLEQQLRGVRNPLGALKTRKAESSEYYTTLPGAPDGEYVVIRFLSSFEHKKEAVETVTPALDEDGNWRVSGYYIR